MLPTQQPIHELCGRDRLNLLPQCSDRQPMNTRQQSTVAPFGLAAARICKLPSQDGATGFQTQECLVDISRRKIKKFYERRTCCGANMREPSADALGQYDFARRGIGLQLREFRFKSR